MRAHPTSRSRNLRTGRTETWQAAAEDGKWIFDRVECSGTPWVVSAVIEGVPVRAIASGFGTLKSAVAAVESGETIAEGLFGIVYRDRSTAMTREAARVLLVEMLTTVPSAAAWLTMLARRCPAQLGLRQPSTIDVRDGQIEIRPLEPAAV